MGKVGVIRKAESSGANMGVSMGSGGASPQLFYSLGGGRAGGPYSKEFIDAYGPVGSNEHTSAMRAHRIGRLGRYGLAGLGALGALYDKTSSCEPGVFGALAGGAMTGWAGSAGLEGAFANSAKRSSDRKYHPSVGRYQRAGGELGPGAAKNLSTLDDEGEDEGEFIEEEGGTNPMDPTMDSLRGRAYGYDDNVDDDAFAFFGDEGNQETDDQRRVRELNEDAARFDWG